MKAKAKTEVTPLEAATNERKRIAQWAYRNRIPQFVGDDIAYFVVRLDSLNKFIGIMPKRAKATPGGAQRKRGL